MKVKGCIETCEVSLKQFVDKRFFHLLTHKPPTKVVTLQSHLLLYLTAPCHHVAPVKVTVFLATFVRSWLGASLTFHLAKAKQRVKTLQLSNFLTDDKIQISAFKVQIPRSVLRACLRAE